MSQVNERTPLLSFLGITHNDPEDSSSSTNKNNTTAPLPQVTPKDVSGSDLHTQFCHLVGVRPPNSPPSSKKYKPDPDSLYHRAMAHHSSQQRIYWFTASLTNTLLLSQIVLGAALTGLGASDSPKALIVVFGALNTVIAGVVAFLKSRGQPMRARMFRDDLERVVDEIENSATMWQGISGGVHGYDAIDIEGEVTVRSEVARLMRLYDRAVKSNTLNDPDMYNGGGFGDMHSAALKGKGVGGAVPAIQTSVLPPVLPAVEGPGSGAVAPVVVKGGGEEDESPASKPAVKKEDEPVKEGDKKGDEESKKEESKKEDDGGAASSSKKEEEKGGAEVKEEKSGEEVKEEKKGEDKGKVKAAADPDESPASAANPPTNGSKK